MLKNSPDYQKQLNDLRTEMGRVGSAQEGILAHHRELAAEEQSRREAAQWHPTMELRSDRQAMTNSLYIAADQHFRIDRIRVKTNSGAVVETLRGDLGQMVRMAEVSIPNQALLELTQRDPDFLRNEKTVGKLECILEVGIVPQQRTFEFAFRVLQDYAQKDGVLTLWRRMDGRL
jgi:hypothetical protein